MCQRARSKQCQCHSQFLAWNSGWVGCGGDLKRSQTPFQILEKSIAAASAMRPEKEKFNAHYEYQKGQNGENLHVTIARDADGNFDCTDNYAHTDNRGGIER